MMHKSSVYSKLVNAHNGIAVLIDPDKQSNEESLRFLIDQLNELQPDFIFVGGSTVTEDAFVRCVSQIKRHSAIPLVIFPGSSVQVDKNADAILFLSLLSGRNPEFLIGQQVEAASKVYSSGIEVIPTAYLLLDGGTSSSVAKASKTAPIPQVENETIFNTSLAGKLLGMQCIYLDAGSGAQNAVDPSHIQSVKTLGLPLIVGGGIRTTAQISRAHQAGANLVVIGNRIEENKTFIQDLIDYKNR
jgi:putative glycerol-1-phosphate prenyltransferase